MARLKKGDRRYKKHSLVRVIGGWFPRLFILPHVIIGICLIVYPFLMLITNVYGTELKATVTDKVSYRDSEGDRAFKVAYKYTWNNKEQEEESGLNRREFKQYNVGDPINVRFFALAPDYTRTIRPVRGEYAQPDLATVAFYAFFALFWNGILSVFVLLLYIVPAVNWYLLRFGSVCEGVIVDKKTDRDDDGKRYFVEYAFRPGRKAQLTSSDQRSTTSTDAIMWDTYSVGDPVCVLYSRTWPKAHLVFEFSGNELAK